MVYCLEQERHWTAALALSLAMITRELAITVYAAVLLFYLIKKDFKKVLIYSISIIPFALWEYLLFIKFGCIFLRNSSLALSVIPGGSIGYATEITRNFESYILNAAAN
jgi:predicted membrane-bound dolichyl-phosphate-mannose-protein mannosyltransferase